MKDYIMQLETITDTPLVAQLLGSEGAFGATSKKLFFISKAGIECIILDDIRRVIRRKGMILILGSGTALLSVRLNVSTAQLFEFFRDVKALTNDKNADLIQHDGLLINQDNAKASEAISADEYIESKELITPLQLEPSILHQYADSGDTVLMAAHAEDQFQSTQLSALKESNCTLNDYLVTQKTEDIIFLSDKALGTTLNTINNARNTDMKALKDTGLDQKFDIDIFASATFWDNPDLERELKSSLLDHLRATSEQAIRTNVAPFYKRVLAGLLDVMIFVFIQTLFAIILRLWPATPLDLLFIPLEQVFSKPVQYVIDVVVVLGFAFIFSWPVFALMESSYIQATPGKWLLGLYIADFKGHRLDFTGATLRHMARLMSGIAGLLIWCAGVLLSVWIAQYIELETARVVLHVFTGIGLLIPILAYLRAFFHELGQALHDQVSNCMVQKTDL